MFLFAKHRVGAVDRPMGNVSKGGRNYRDVMLALGISVLKKRSDNPIFDHQGLEQKII